MENQVIKKNYKNLNNLMNIGRSIKGKYDKLYLLETSNQKESKEYEDILHEIKALKYFENLLLQKLPKNIDELEEIIKYLYEHYSLLADDTLLYLIPRSIPFKNYAATRLINQIIDLIIKNYYELMEGNLEYQNTVFTLELEQYFAQDIIKLLLSINQNNDEPFLKPLMGKQKYDLGYCLSFLEGELLAKRFVVDKCPIIYSDTLSKKYQIDEDALKERISNMVYKICKDELVFMLNMDIVYLDSVNNLFALYNSQGLVLSALLLANDETVENVRALMENNQEEDGSYEKANKVAAEIFRKLDNQDFSLTRIQFGF
ncbi:MAG: hypothetical protein ACLUFU_05150 [Bacilli bacterium]